MSKLCPQCGGKLDRVTQGDHAMLNSEQFNSIKAGDYVCDTCPDNNRGKSGKAYFWEREVIDTVASRGLTDAECLREVALIVGKSCDEDVITAVQRVLASATEQLQRADAENVRLHNVETVHNVFCTAIRKAIGMECAMPIADIVDNVVGLAKDHRKLYRENAELRATLEATETAFVILYEKWLTAEKRQDMNEAMDALALALGRPAMCKHPHGFPCCAFKPVLKGELEACEVCKPHLAKIRALQMQ